MIPNGTAATTRNSRAACIWLSYISASRLTGARRRSGNRRRRRRRPISWSLNCWAQKSSADANDLIYQYEGSRGYNPAPKLETIKARLLAINSADDERNPPELGILEREIKRVKQGRYILIPPSAETRGHGTTGNAKLWKHYLAELL